MIIMNIILFVFIAKSGLVVSFRLVIDVTLFEFYSSFGFNICPVMTYLFSISTFPFTVYFLSILNLSFPWKLVWFKFLRKEIFLPIIVTSNLYFMEVSLYFSNPGSLSFLFWKVDEAVPCHHTIQSFLSAPVCYFLRD